MEIYFLRHGEAEGSLYNTAEADFERELTDRGRKMIEQEADGLRFFVTGFDYILTSPLTRARQTAEIFAAAYDCGERIRVTSAVNPPLSPSDFMEEIALLGQPKRVLCVGHAPALGELATYILSGLDEENFFDIKKGGILGLFVDSPRPGADARMLCFFPPDVLQKIGSGVSIKDLPSLDVFSESAPPAHRVKKNAGPDIETAMKTQDISQEPPQPQGWDPELDTPDRRRNIDESQQFSGPKDRRGRQYPPVPEEEEDLGAILEEEVNSLQSALDSLMGGFSGGGDDRGARDALKSFLGKGSPKKGYDEPPPQLRGIDIQM